MQSPSGRHALLGKGVLPNMSSLLSFIPFSFLQGENEVTMERRELLGRSINRLSDQLFHINFTWVAAVINDGSLESHTYNLWISTVALKVSGAISLKSYELKSCNSVALVLKILNSAYAMSKWLHSWSAYPLFSRAAAALTCYPMPLLGGSFDHNRLHLPCSRKNTKPNVKMQSHKVVVMMVIL